MKICSFFLSLVFLVSCQNNENHLVENKNEFKTERIEEEVITANSFLEKKHTDSILFQRNLVDVQSIDPTIQVELKYTTTDNFIGEILYTRIKNAYLQKDVAERLSKCQSLLKSIHPSYSLLIYDAVRPVSVQQKMWDALDTIPRYERGKFVSNPAHRSLHNYGAAVDVTIVDESGVPLDMGAGFDDIRKIAYPSLEASFLASGELTQQHIENRKLLRKVMTSEGFRNIPTEWWHFNACSRDAARLKYTTLKEEPENF